MGDRTWRWRHAATAGVAWSVTHSTQAQSRTSRQQERNLNGLACLSKGVLRAWTIKA